jgi:integrase
MLLQQCEADPTEDIKENPDLKLVIRLGLPAGLRRGEIFALHFDDIDWNRDLIHVRRNLFWRYGKYQDVPKGKEKFLIGTPTRIISAPISCPSG